MAAEFIIEDVDSGPRLTIAGPLTDADDLAYYRVQIEYTGLSAEAPIYRLDAGDFAAFFAELAQHPNGWSGVKTAQTLDGDFVVECEYCRGYFRPRVRLHITLAIDTSEPCWTVRVRMDQLAAMQLDLSKRAERFFIGSANH